jgi:hypothetical protein
LLSFASSLKTDNVYLLEPDSKTFSAYSLSGWNLRAGWGIKIPKELGFDLLPRNGLNGSGVEIRHAALNLCKPCGLDTFFGLSVKALYQ